MGITNLLVGDSVDLAAAKDATKASLDAKLAAIQAQLTGATRNYFLEPCAMNDVLTDFFKDVNGGLPSDKA